MYRHPVFPPIFVEDQYIFVAYFLKKEVGDCSNTYLCLGLFCSIDFHACFCASSILMLLLLLSNMILLGAILIRTTTPGMKHAYVV